MNNAIFSSEHEQANASLNFKINVTCEYATNANAKCQMQICI